MRQQDLEKCYELFTTRASPSFLHSFVQSWSNSLVIPVKCMLSLPLKTNQAFSAPNSVFSSIAGPACRAVLCSNSALSQCQVTGFWSMKIPIQVPCEWVKNNFGSNISQLMTHVPLQNSPCVTVWSISLWKRMDLQGTINCSACYNAVTL